MADADGVVLEALLDDIVTPDIVDDAISEALQLLERQDDGTLRAIATSEAARLEAECARFRSAIAAAGELDELVAGLRKRERRLKALCTTSNAIASQRPVGAGDTSRLCRELKALAAEWRQVLADDPEHARPIVSRLLVGRVSFRPLETRGRWELSGEGTLAGLFERSVISAGMASPTGFDSTPCSIFRSKDSPIFASREATWLLDGI